MANAQGYATKLALTNLLYTWTNREKEVRVYTGAKGGTVYGTSIANAPG
jgi:hypothetical protein